jgi:hypothetical protein
MDDDARAALDVREQPLAGRSHAGEGEGIVTLVRSQEAPGLVRGVVPAAGQDRGHGG